MRTIDEAAEAVILEVALEDFAGLWEIAGVLRSRRSFRDAEAAAKRFVRDLWLRGLVDLVWGNPNPNKRELVKREDGDAVLDDERYWNSDLPFSGQTVWVTTTAEGERWLNESIKPTSRSID